MLVSADQDYLEVMREKVAQGMKVYWVATAALMSDALLEILRVEDGFNFVELADHKDELMKSAWREREREPRQAEPAQPKRTIAASIEMSATHEEAVEFVDLVKKAMAKFPKITKLNFELKS